MLVTGQQLKTILGPALFAAYYLERYESWQFYPTKIYHFEPATIYNTNTILAQYKNNAPALAGWFSFWCEWDGIWVTSTNLGLLRLEQRWQKENGPICRAS